MCEFVRFEQPTTVQLRPPPIATENYVTPRFTDGLKLSISIELLFSGVFCLQIESVISFYFKKAGFWFCHVVKTYDFEFISYFESNIC